MHRISKVYNLYFELVIVEEKYLRNKSLVLLKTNNSYLSSSKLPKLERKLIQGPWEEQKLINPLDERDTEEKKKLIIFTGQNLNKINKNILILNKISTETKGNIFFLRSMFPKFYKFINLLKEAKWNLIKYHTFIEITNCCKSLVEYLFGESTCMNNNHWNIREQANSTKQSFIKNCGFIEILTDVIYLSDLFLKVGSGNKFWMQKTLMMSYTILRYSIQEYRPNELFAC